MASKEEAYYLPQVGEQVYLDRRVKYWDPKWGRGPFEVLRVFKKGRLAKDPVEKLTLQTPVGRRRVSGYWFEALNESNSDALQKYTDSLAGLDNMIPDDTGLPNTNIPYAAVSRL